MPAQKRKHVDAYQGSPDQPIVIDESDHEDKHGDVELERPSKKRKTAHLSDQLANGFSNPTVLVSAPPSPMPSEPLPLSNDQPVATTSGLQDPWDTARDGLRQMIFAVWEKHNNSVDGFIGNALYHLNHAVLDLERNPGRSPAYKTAQLAKIGNSPLLNLPGEIRNVIWEFANPPEVCCCLTGSETHDHGSTACRTEDQDSALIRALVGRGIPASRQVLWETCGVATPVGLRFCSWWCADDCVLRIKQSNEPPVLRGSWEKGKPWRNIWKLEVDLRSDIKRDWSHLSLEEARSHVSKGNDSYFLKRLNESCKTDKWMSYTIDNTYVLEKIPSNVVEEAECHDD